MDEKILEQILNELKEHGQKLSKLDNVESELKKHTKQFDDLNKKIKIMQEDITDIKKHIEVGIYVDLERVKERLTILEQKIV